MFPLNCFLWFIAWHLFSPQKVINVSISLSLLVHRHCPSVNLFRPGHLPVLDAFDTAFSSISPSDCTVLVFGISIHNGGTLRFYIKHCIILLHRRSYRVPIGLDETSITSRLYIVGDVLPFILDLGFEHSHERLCTKRTNSFCSVFVAKRSLPFHCVFMSQMETTRKH